MKKVWIPAALCIALAVAGCGVFFQSDDSLEEAGSAYELEPGQTEVYGKVRDAYGNEITLVIGTPVQDGPQGGFADDNGPRGDNAMPDRDGFSGDDGVLPAGGSGAMPTDSGGQPGGGIMEQGGGSGEGGRGQRDGGGEGNRGPSGGGMPAGITLEYTGEEITYQIPVTASITTGQGENARTVRFTQIGTKNIVRLVLDENGVIVSLQILE